LTLIAEGRSGYMVAGFKGRHPAITSGRLYQK
jgi:hypothetical protein